MDKEQLKQIRYIKTEIEVIQKQIDNLEPASAIDKVNGSSNHFPYTKRSFTVEGIDTVEYRQKAQLLQRKLEYKKQELTDKLIELEKFIDNIPDSLVRQIIRLRYIECLTWNKIARLVGNNNTADSVRMIVNRYLQ